MSVNMILNLHDITLIDLQEDEQDEIYVIGGVKVSRAGNPVQAKSKYFASSNVIKFTEADKGKVRKLNPQGQVYNEVLENDEVAHVRLYVVEHDAASTVKDVTGKLGEFLESSNLGELLQKTPIEAGADLAKVLLEFIDTLGNVFDDDDIVGEWRKTYRMPTIVSRRMKPGNVNVWTDDISFSANMDDALYKPVTAKAHFIKM